MVNDQCQLCNKPIAYDYTFGDWYCDDSEFKCTEAAWVTVFTPGFFKGHLPLTHDLSGGRLVV